MSNEILAPKRLKFVTVVSSAFGVVYLILGTCGLLAKTSHLCLTEVTPANVGMSVLLISIGAILFSSILTLRRDITLSLASSFVGSLLAVSAMVIQVLAVGATWLDYIINGQSFGKKELVAGLLRADALLGYFMLMLFPVVFKTVKKYVIKSS